MGLQKAEAQGTPEGSLGLSEMGTTRDSSMDPLIPSGVSLGQAIILLLAPKDTQMTPPPPAAPQSTWLSDGEPQRLPSVDPPIPGDSSLFWLCRLVSTGVQGTKTTPAPELFFEPKSLPFP